MTELTRELSTTLHPGNTLAYDDILYIDVPTLVYELDTRSLRLVPDDENEQLVVERLPEGTVSARVSGQVPTMADVKRRTDNIRLLNDIRRNHESGPSSGLWDFAPGEAEEIRQALDEAKRELLKGPHDSEQASKANTRIAGLMAAGMCGAALVALAKWPTRTLIGLATLKLSSGIVKSLLIAARPESMHE